MLSPFFFCGWWTKGTGQILPGCLGNWWQWGALRPAGPWWWWDVPGTSEPVIARRIAPAGERVTWVPGAPIGPSSPAGAGKEIETPCSASSAP